MPRRRLKGEGTFKERSDGRVEYVVYINKKPKSFYGKDRITARKKYKEFMIKTAKPSLDATTMEEYMLDWFTDIKEPNLKPLSAMRLKGTIINNIAPAIGHYGILEITADDIRTHLINPAIKKYSYSSCKKIYDAMNACLNYALIHGDRTGINPMLLIEKPSKNLFSVKDRIYFDADQITNFVTTAQSIFNQNSPRGHNAPAFILMMYTGLRMGEVLALKWNDFDEKKRTIRVDQDLIMEQNADGTYKITIQDTPKTEAGNRTIYLGEKAYRAILELRKKNYRGDENGFICTTLKGSCVSPSSFQKTLNYITKTAKLPSIGTHTIRHTFASMLIRNNVDIKIISEILGHSSVSFTYDTYIHLFEEQKVKAMKVVDGL